jgi:hypothetical protein
MSSSSSAFDVAELFQFIAQPLTLFGPDRLQAMLRQIAMDGDDGQHTRGPVRAGRKGTTGTVQGVVDALSAKTVRFGHAIAQTDA